ncbi:MAG TPA: hypothetical protein VII33_17005 [Nakamurella sp.]
MPEQLRIALTIPGAVALGAYEAGALAALINGIRAANAGGDNDIAVDVIGSSSSGSLTGLLAARCLLEGLDPVVTLGAAWVQQASSTRLMGHGFAAPFSFRNMRKDAKRLLASTPATVSAPTQSTKVRLSLAVQNLRGLGFKRASVSTPTYDTVSHLDWLDYTVEKGMSVAQLTEPETTSVFGAVLASAANQLAFPPRLLVRPLGEEPYDEITNPPSSGDFWCSDAAILDREPIGRSLAVAREVDEEHPDENVTRLHLVVEPQPRVAAQALDWSNPKVRPTWLQVLARTAAITEAQSVFADITGIDDCNTRLDAVDGLMARLDPVLDGLPAESAGLLVAALDGPAGGASRDVVKNLVRQAIAEAAQVVGRRQVTVAVISPDLVQTGAASVNDRLAGEFIFRFGGLLDQRLRQSDFDLGYKSTLVWLQDDAGLGKAASPVALAAATKAYPPAAAIGEGWVPPELSFAGRMRMVRMAWRLGVVTVHDVIVGRRAHNRAVKGAGG